MNHRRRESITLGHGDTHWHMEMSYTQQQQRVKRSVSRKLPYDSVSRLIRSKIVGSYNHIIYQSILLYIGIIHNIYCNFDYELARTTGSSC